VHDVFIARHHPELVRLSGGALRVLAAVPGGLPPRAIADIWCACERSAEEDVRDAVALIAEILPALPPVEAGALLDCVIGAGGTRFPL
jgi:hypothetical protein